MFLFFSFVDSWKKGGPGNQKPAEDPNLTKGITFVNNAEKSIMVIVNFKYSDNEFVEKSAINIKYNKIDSLYIKKDRGGYYLLPIFYKDTIKFPEKFNIKIKDSLGSIIKEYDNEEFFNSIEKLKYTKINDIECKETSWTLKIK
ncbi:hypothetical protein [Flavobacterium sp. PL02]|uniref:hypothetical protein n=1 Tax=Flavobacterium sp. PL02 TaxID=3088354 RepID=UPI002B22340A|nr:hypothetical protein [Flavobacterium sp. PL02]MEA9412111.1 hypothetical protein [Flavobacterium sp. PL02]